jgi:DNA-directed RNA polymerase specialized sigma24 family protein
MTESHAVPMSARSVWELSYDALTRLLARLDPDPERAAEQYEQLRYTLIKFFDWRGVTEPQECADIAIDRIARKLEEGQDIGNISGFAHGVARRVLLEHTRRPDARRAELHDVSVAAADDDSDDPLRACFEHCLGQVPDEERQTLLRYYGGDHRARIDSRAVLARELCVSAGALRSRAARLRDRLERCTLQCMQARGIPSSVPGTLT